MSDLYSILDTAVKIGLGAVISGVSTYLITSKNHKHDLNKNAVNVRSKTLEYAVDNLEPYFYALTDYISLLEGILLSDEKPRKITHLDLENFGITDVDNKLIEMRPKILISASRLRLLGKDKAVETIEEVFDVETELRKQVLFNLTLPNESDLDNYHMKFRTLKNALYDNLAMAFSETIENK